MSDPELDYNILRADFTIVARERFTGGEPTDYLSAIRGTLFVEDEHGNETAIGSMTGTYIDIAQGHMDQDQHSIFDLFDCDSELYAEAYKSVFDPSTDDYWEEFEDAIAPGFNVLVIDEVKLDRQDDDIAIRFLKLIVDTNASGAGIAIAFRDSGLPEKILHALEFFPSPRVPSIFILNRAAPFQGAITHAHPPDDNATAN